MAISNGKKLLINKNKIKPRMIAIRDKRKSKTICEVAEIIMEWQLSQRVWKACLI